jgi:hypothetical protein
MFLDDMGPGPIIQRKEFIFVGVTIAAVLLAWVYDHWIVKKVEA